jgi:hypothetical protein
MARKRRRLKIVERKLGRERAWGLRWADGLIEVDPRQKSRAYLDTLIHEVLHECLDELSEKKVVSTAGMIAEAVWGAKYRRIMP